MKRIVATVLFGVLVLSACNRIEESNWVRLDDISYVVPTNLPDGYSYAYATERPGQPFKEWDSHAELYANEARDEFISIGATAAGRGAPTRPSPPTADGPITSAYLIGFINGDINTEKRLESLQTTWRSASLQWSVIHDAVSPDADLVLRIARKFKNGTALNFPAPKSVAPGFTNIGSAGAAEVADYTMVFRPTKFVGASRAEATDDGFDDVPSIGVNVGAHFYAQRPDLTSLDKATFDDTEDYVRLEFVLRGSVVSVGSSTATRDEMMAVAKSLKSYSYREWKLQWGDRLLTQDVPGSE